MKVVYSDKKSGKTSQAEVPKDAESMLLGKKIGETIEGARFGLEGYEFQITGLSDKMGAPSRKEVEGSRKTYILLTEGNKGKRRRRLIRGNTVSVETGQINTVITKQGTKTLEELFPKKAESKEKAE